MAAADFSLGTWQTTGSQLWSTSFPIDSFSSFSKNGSLNGKSELYYPHITTYTTLNYETSLSPHKKFRLEGGLTNSLRQARGSDADWDYTHSNDYWYYGEFQTSGKSGYIKIDIIKELTKNNNFFWGYSYHINHYRMTQGHYFIDNYNTVNTDYPALDSAYTMIYQGPHLGLTSKVPLTAKVSLVGTLAYSPLALVQGQGWWNLRDMNFSHIGTGQVLDAALGAELGQKNKVLVIGYRYKYASLYHGWENLSSTISWDKANFIQRGPFVSGKVAF